MRISPIYSYNPNTYKRSRQTFCAMPDSFYEEKGLKRGQFIGKNGTICNSNVTCYLREDIDWYNFGKYLKNKIQNIENCDIDIFACSTGEEAYTMAILLKHLYGLDADFKINAYDINKGVIDNCKKSQQENVKITSFLLDKIQKHLNLTDREIQNYFSEREIEILYDIKPEILNSVQFEQANILTSLDKINSSKPTILMARNMWPYVYPEEYEDFAKELFERLKTGSFVVLGGFDKLGINSFPDSNRFYYTLSDVGFKNPRKNLDKNTRFLIFEKK